ncbi:MAG: RES family NAD+ phosphorylase [Chitinophagaceae bacterium]|nr:RES family NAD+ phosphorylase [Chitinophagaceae bacterium]MBK7556959.1 RES family NAD+ phosphorylase [Chitinophagaceae bacterium]MBK9532354.1 RES family NAD+ phosphorylase [Chitinophagaceae bacterium]HQW91538.1 RES family NAD+ phosphorylase [Ferruginibacter sp.]
MIVYRISNTEFSNDISGTGAKLMGSRWNTRGVPLLYTSQHISLAVLEMLVNTNFKDYSIELDLMYIHIPDQLPFTEIKSGSLKKNWKDDFDFTRYIGDEFVSQKDVLILKVPSAVIQEEFNYLANPLHADFKKIKIVNTKSFWPDERLFKI